MLKIITAVFALSFLAPSQAFAEKAKDRPYAGEEKREIKALSPDEIGGYLKGKGMGFAKAAELNHYPGPSHVITFASELGLSDDLLARTKTVFDKMQRKTQKLGRQLVDKEKILDSLFKNRKINNQNLKSLVNEIAIIKGEIRVTHLETHLEMKGMLSPHQVAEYDRLRGYVAGHGSAMPEHGQKKMH